MPRRSVTCRRGSHCAVPPMSFRNLRRPLTRCSAGTRLHSRGKRRFLKHSLPCAGSDPRAHGGWCPSPGGGGRFQPPGGGCCGLAIMRPRQQRRHDEREQNGLPLLTFLETRRPLAAPQWSSITSWATSSSRSRLSALPPPRCRPCTSSSATPAIPVATSGLGPTPAALPSATAAYAGQRAAPADDDSAGKGPVSDAGGRTSRQADGLIKGEEADR